MSTTPIPQPCGIIPLPCGTIPQTQSPQSRILLTISDKKQCLRIPTPKPCGTVSNNVKFPLNVAQFPHHVVRFPHHVVQFPPPCGTIPPPCGTIPPPCGTISQGWALRSFAFGTLRYFAF